MIINIVHINHKFNIYIYAIIHAIFLEKLNGSPNIKSPNHHKSDCQIIKRLGGQQSTRKNSNSS